MKWNICRVIPKGDCRRYRLSRQPFVFWPLQRRILLWAYLQNYSLPLNVLVHVLSALWLAVQTVSDYHWTRGLRTKSSFNLLDLIGPWQNRFGTQISPSECRHQNHRLSRQFQRMWPRIVGQQASAKQSFNPEARQRFVLLSWTTANQCVSGMVTSLCMIVKAYHEWKRVPDGTKW